MPVDGEMQRVDRRSAGSIAATVAQIDAHEVRHAISDRLRARSAIRAPKRWSYGPFGGTISLPLAPDTRCR
jgi:hypothetical protein